MHEQSSRPPISRLPGRRKILAAAAGCLVGIHVPALARAAGFSPWCVAFSPDGRTLAAGADDAVIRLWEVPGGKVIRELGGHRDAVFGLSFSPDGKRLASCGRDAPRVR